MDLHTGAAITRIQIKKKKNKTSLNFSYSALFIKYNNKLVSFSCFIFDLQTFGEVSLQAKSVSAAFYIHHIQVFYTKNCCKVLCGATINRVATEQAK